MGWQFPEVQQFNKGKCQALHLGRNNPVYHYRLLWSRLAEEDLGVVIDNKLTVNQQCTLKWGKLSPGGIRQSTANRSREQALHFWSALFRPLLESWVQSWASQYTSGKAERAGIVQHGWQRVQRVCVCVLLICVNRCFLWRCKDRARHFSVVATDRPGGKRHKLNQRKFPLTRRKHF